MECSLSKLYFCWTLQTPFVRTSVPFKTLNWIAGWSLKEEKKSSHDEFLFRTKVTSVRTRALVTTKNRTEQVRNFVVIGESRKMSNFEHVFLSSTCFTVLNSCLLNSGDGFLVSCLENINEQVSWFYKYSYRPLEYSDYGVLGNSDDLLSINK